MNIKKFIYTHNLSAYIYINKGKEWRREKGGDNNRRERWVTDTLAAQGKGNRIK